MAERKNPGRVEFGAPVPQEEYDFFKEQFPQYGAVTWFVNQSLITFNQHVRENPTSKELIEKSIDEMVEMNRALRALAVSGETND